MNEINIKKLKGLRDRKIITMFFLSTKKYYCLTPYKKRAEEFAEKHNCKIKVIELNSNDIALRNNTNNFFFTDNNLYKKFKAVKNLNNELKIYIISLIHHRTKESVTYFYVSFKNFVSELQRIKNYSIDTEIIINSYDEQYVNLNKINLKG